MCRANDKIIIIIFRPKPNAMCCFASHRHHDNIFNNWRKEPMFLHIPLTPPIPLQYNVDFEKNGALLLPPEL